MNCVCLICHKPNTAWFDFLSKFKKYTIYVIIDDNNIEYKEQFSNYSNINIIQIKNEECENNGFINTDYKKNGLGWAKALYYFSSIQTNYTYVWFIEDDVFLYDEMTLINIDMQYNDADLLTKSFNNTYTSGPKDFWHWSWITIELPSPYFRAMCCASRMSSSTVLKKIKEYANTYKTLFFHEAISPTICQHYKYNYKNPEELKTIEYRHNYDDTDINEKNLFHPVKDITKHAYYRDMINKMKSL
jgi:hypothetical protein